MNNMQLMVEEFHAKIGVVNEDIEHLHFFNDEEDILSTWIALLKSAWKMLHEQAKDYRHPMLVRLDFMLEELIELAEAFLEEDPIEIVDALGDLQYFLLGTASILGVDMEQIHQRIHYSNMLKPSQYGFDNRDKGSEWKPPYFNDILRIPDRENTDTTETPTRSCSVCGGCKYAQVDGICNSCSDQLGV